MSLSPWLTLVLVISFILLVSCEGDSEVDIYGNRQAKSDAAANKRPFFVGSRYGRSQYGGGNGLRQVNVVPRNDRFFLGSRYGKRSGVDDGTFNDVIEQYGIDNMNGGISYLTCLHTGVSNLYRCYGKGKTENNSEEHTLNDVTNE